VEEDRREVQAVGADELWQTARDHFSPDRLKVAAVGPFREKDRREVVKLLDGYGE
jgi:predicted Zn-dependent peptidase